MRSIKVQACLWGDTIVPDELILLVQLQSSFGHRANCRCGDNKRHEEAMHCNNRRSKPQSMREAVQISQFFEQGEGGGKAAQYGLEPGVRGHDRLWQQQQFAQQQMARFW